MLPRLLGHASAHTTAEYAKSKLRQLRELVERCSLTFPLQKHGGRQGSCQRQLIGNSVVEASTGPMGQV